MKINIKGFMRLCLLLFGVIPLALFVCSCSESSKKNPAKAEVTLMPKSMIIKKPGSSFNDTVLINGKSAVFYGPDSVQMRKIKSVNEKATFDLLTHNCHYQMENARKVLKKWWPQIKMVETSNTRYLLFQKTNKSKVCIDLNDKNDICGLFLFDGKKDPALVDMPNIDTQLNLYFSHKGVWIYH